MFEEFIRERPCLQNVSHRTIIQPSPSQADLNSFVIRMRERGPKPSLCNNRIRARA
jgi:hypothetical protein